MASDLVQRIKLSLSVLGAKNTANALKEVANNTKKLHNDVKLIEKPLDKVNLRMLALQKSLQKQGKDWRALGISMELGKKALLGEAAAINTVNQQLIALNKTSILSVRNNRNLNGSFSVMRSKLLLVSFGIMLVERAVLNLVKAHAAQEAVNQKLAAGLANIADTTPGVTQRLVEFSSAMQQATTFGDELITNGMAQLTTFTLNEESIKSLTPQVLNIARAIQQTSGQMPDLNSLFIAFGKSTTTAVSALTRYGVVLTDTEKSQLESMNANERAGKIAEILDKQYGGLSEAYKNTTAGALEAAAAARGDLAEAFGEALAPTITFVVQGLTFLMEKMHPGRAARFASAIGVGGIVMGVMAIQARKANAELTIQAFIMKRHPILFWGGVIALVVGSLLEWFKVWGDGSEIISDHAKRVKDLQKDFEGLTEAQADGIISLEKRHEVLHNLIAQERAKSHAILDGLKVQAMAIKTDHEESEAELKLMEKIVAHERELQNLKDRKQDVIELNEKAAAAERKLFRMMEKTNAGQQIQIEAQIKLFQTLPESTQATEEYRQAVEKLEKDLAKLKTTETELTDIQKKAKSALESTVLAKKEQIEATITELQLQMQVQGITDETTDAYKNYTEAIKNLRKELEGLNGEKAIQIEIDKEMARITQEMANIQFENYSNLASAAEQFASEDNQRFLDSERQKIESQKDTIRATVKNKKQQAILLAKEDAKIAALEKQQHNRMITIKQLSLLADMAIAIGKIKMAGATAVALARAQFGVAADPLITKIRAEMMANIASTVIANTMAAGILQAQRYAKGGDFITDKPEMIMVGEAGRERVTITPVDRPESRALGSMGEVTINFTGNVMSQDFIEDEAIPMIKEALRRGGDLDHHHVSGDLLPTWTG